MDGCEHVLADKALVQKNGVLVVVAFPRHEADEHVLAERDLALRAGGAVGDDLTGLDALTDRDDRALVDAGALVGACELRQRVVDDIAVVIADGNGGRGNAGNDAGALGRDADLGVHCALVLDAGGDDRCLRDHQRHSLTLHVRAHQRTVRVVVFQERDKGRRNGGHHLRRDIHIVDHIAVNGNDLVAVAAGHTLVDQAAVLIDRLRSLRDVVIVLDVRGHVFDGIGDAVGALFDLAERSLDKAVFIDAGIGGQIVDQADVRAFRGLDGAHSAVVRVVNVSHVEGSALTGQAAGAES